MSATFTVSIHVYSKILLPEAIGRALDLRPSQTILASKKSKNARAELLNRNIWVFDCGDEFDSLELGLLPALELLEPRSEALTGLSEFAKVCLWCGCFFSGPEVGISLTPSIIARVAKLGVGIELSTYFCDDQ